MSQQVGPITSERTGRKRLGCLTQLLLSLALGVIVVEGVVALTAPWAFTLGGHFHLIPTWQGWGRLHSATAGDYVLFVSMFPSPRGSGRGGTNVTGTARLCTPRGAHYTLRLGGGTNRNVWLHMDGEPFGLYLANRPAWWSFTSPDYRSWRPSIELRGRWQFPNLVMDDHGTLSREFLPDGTLYSGPAKNQPTSREIITVTLTEGSKSEFESACAASQR